MQGMGHSDSAPSAYLTLPVFIVTNCHDGTVIFEGNGMGTARSNGDYIAPIFNLTLSVFGVAGSHHCAVGFKSHGMATSCGYGRFRPFLYFHAFLRSKRNSFCIDFVLMFGCPLHQARPEPFASGNDICRIG